MAILNETIEAGGSMPPATIKVWDRFVRFFHWSLATLFVLAYATGDEVAWVHLAAGYTIGGLVLLRLVWGIVGPPHARFRNFVRPPREVLAYLREVASRRARRHVGHNPAGGAMVVALLAVLSLTSITGFMMTTDLFWGSQWVEDVHGVLANLTVILIVLHVLGVIATSFEHRENLPKAMITGRKRAT